MPNTITLQPQNQIVPMKRTISEVIIVDDEKAHDGPTPTGTKRKKAPLKINIKAANNVDDEANFYNKTNSVPKPENVQSDTLKQDLESKSMVHENSVGSAGKKEIATDYMPNFFSFKDYELKIGQTRGNQTCRKVVNRTLNPPTPIRANPEVHLDSQSHSKSKSHHSQSQQSASLKQ